MQVKRKTAPMYQRMLRMYPVRLLFNRGAFVGFLTGGAIGAGFMVSAGQPLALAYGATVMICAQVGLLFGGMVWDILAESMCKQAKGGFRHGNFRMNEQCDGNVIDLAEELREYHYLGKNSNSISMGYGAFVARSSVRAFLGGDGRPYMVEQAAVEVSEAEHKAG